ncbi:RNA polymerase I-specific transcription initiation factor RRN3-like isoform X2 [Schistocerca gregaria]|uniref:RNA polymerase I-specific transcription initiation factor RRN3-like isoform X2 n=1 Tax=Schistocerca gregaria TaxID=7010 RepID=UPI00211EBF22|nr:RNA polymerase I-specific transcription initiation factor RRN3-like isoform X2 [Schistocerca gregaria]
MSKLQSATVYRTSDYLIIDALREKLRGNSASYCLIVQELNSGSRLSAWYSMLTKSVTEIKVVYYELITAIFSFDWFSHTRPQEVAAYSTFLVHLNCAHGGTYLYATYSSIAKAFRGPIAASVTALQEKPKYDVEAAFKNLHDLVQRLLKLLPNSLSYFISTLVDKFPHKVLEAPMHLAFAENILKACEYCPQLLKDVIELLVDRIIQIDVEIRRETLIQGVEGEGSGVFEVDMGVSYQEEQLVKVDQVLDVLLCWIARIDSDALLDEVFSIMLDIFDKFLMLSNEVKYAQWILFYLCRLRKAYASSFLEHLFTNLEDESLAPLSRQRCVLYIGSFVGRATYLNRVSAQRVLCALIDWMKSYVSANATAYPDVERHCVFYAAFQGLCYMLHFAHGWIFEGCGNEEMRSLGLDEIVLASLNPIKVCRAEFSQSFLKVVARYGLRYDSLVERNEKIVLDSSCKTDRSYQDRSAPSVTELLCIYPFDPCRLPRSDQHFLDVCRHPEHRSLQECVAAGHGEDEEASEEDLASGLGVELDVLDEKGDDDLHALLDERMCSFSIDND